MNEAPLLLNLPPGAFSRVDEGDDAEFYTEARLVNHVDDAALAALTELYRAILPAAGEVLDLMSSWVSHLPADIDYQAVIGHGMNAAELSANTRLTRWFVQDLNQTPDLRLADDSLDAALICVGIQYLQRPVEVLTSVRRVLRPGAPVVISFSNRCFATKAVAVWRALDDRGRAVLVSHYLSAAGFVGIQARAVRPGASGDPLTVVIAHAPGGHLTSR